jgi:uncharacterized protein (TIGR03067 family)
MYGKAKFNLDRSKTPMALDVYNIQGANEGKMQRGICALDGKTLKLCLAMPGQERPDDFTSTAQNARTLTIWTRVRK